MHGLRKSLWDNKIIADLLLIWLYAAPGSEFFVFQQDSAPITSRQIHSSVVGSRCLILSHPLSGRLTHRTSTRLTTPCGVCFRSESIVPRSWTSTNWNEASTASGPLWVTRLLTVLLKRGVSVYALAFVLEADVLSTRWNKDCVMWHVRQWLFWETMTVSHVCCYLVNHSNACTLNYCIDGLIWHFKFPKVVQAHTLGEVGI